MKKLLLLVTLLKLAEVIADWKIDKRCLRRRRLGYHESYEDDHLLDPLNAGDVTHIAGNATHIDQQNPVSTGRSLQTLSRFRLKMYWYVGACWQEEWIERRWCMECQGDRCDVGDILQIKECANNKKTQQFTWQPRAGTGGGRLKVYEENLCLEKTGSNEFELRGCSNDSKQILIGFNINKPFELFPKGDSSKCINQHHHPKSGEEIIATRCSTARKWSTSKWEAIDISGSGGRSNGGGGSSTGGGGSNGGGGSGAGSNNRLRDGTCSKNSPCGECVGDCNSHADCQNGLKCFFRRSSNAFETIPGCAGRGKSGRDYCYSPN